MSTSLVNLFCINFTSCKFILLVGNKIVSCKLFFCEMRVANLKKFFGLQVVFYELKIKNFIIRVLRVESLRR